jgi:hypothetical protein
MLPKNGELIRPVSGLGMAMIRSRAVSGLFWLVLAMTLHVWPWMVGPAHAQGSRKDDIVFNSRGIPLAGASVHVCTMPATGQPCSPSALIYSDPGLTQAMANPTMTDGLGNYYFYAAPGQYEIEISGPGITTKQIPNVILPSDPQSPTFSSLSTTGGITAFTLNLSGNLSVNGSTTVAGNLASGTLNLTNQATPPGAASAGTVNLYTKTADMRLYYKDQTGTEIGPLATASGAQTNQANIWTAVQTFAADVHSKGPNPWYDVMTFGGYTGPNYDTPTTCTISLSTPTTCTLGSALDFANGNGILVWGAGPATGLAAPQAPTVTPYWQTGSGNYCYAIAEVDYYGGMTAAGGVGCTTTGPASFGQKTYSINAMSSTGNGTTMTFTTSAAHNIPTSAYHNGQWPQVELTGFGNQTCNGAFTLTGVQSTTTFTINLGGAGTPANCTSGSVNVLPIMEVKWDDHSSIPVTNYQCNTGGTSATVTVPTFYSQVYGAYQSALFNISGSSDATYNGTTFYLSGNTNTTLTFAISCNVASDSGNFGGVVNMQMNHATKTHLIYRCPGTSSTCALPANASSYTLVGASDGDDTYFVDKGYTLATASIDQGQYPATAPTSAVPQYLDTTISAGGGTTTLTLANAASTAVTSAKAWHDNVPNIYATCASMANNGTLYVPVPTSAAGPGTAEFPIIGNLIARPVWANPPTYNCGDPQWYVGAPIWQRGTIEWNGNIRGIPGATGCVPTSYAGSGNLACFTGYANPMFHFQTNLSGSQLFENFIVQTNQSYQAGLFWDIDNNANGPVGFWMTNVHANGANASNPVIIKGGFGWFWTQGGWSSSASNYYGGRDFVATTICAQNAYQLSSSAQFPYIVRATETYMFGTSEVDNCGNASMTFAGDWKIKNPLIENTRGPAWRFNSGTGIRDFQIEDPGYADDAGGLGTPLLDFVNGRAVGGVELSYPLCPSVGPMVETAVGQNQFKFKTNAGKSCAYSGIDPTNNPNTTYSWEALNASTDYKANWTMQLQGPNAKLGAGQITNPSNAPTLSLTTTCPAGNLAAGTYTYAISVWDGTSNYTNSAGGQTQMGPTASITQDGSHCTLISQPALPGGSVYWGAYRTNGPGATGSVFAGNGSNCGPSFLPVSYTTITDTYAYACGSQPYSNTTSLQVFTASNITGNILAATEATEGQCFSSAAPAQCESFIDGFVTIAAGSSSVTVNTTAVTAGSNIQLVFDSSIGSKLGVTCNTTPQQPFISARTAGTSFTVSVPANFSTNPGCIGFHIKN